MSNTTNDRGERIAAFAFAAIIAMTIVALCYTAYECGYGNARADAVLEHPCGGGNNSHSSGKVYE